MLKTTLHYSLKAYFRCFYRCQVHGIENLNSAPNNSLIIANHSSTIDSILLAIFLPKQLFFAINLERTENKFASKILGWLKIKIIHPDTTENIGLIIKGIKDNKQCVIFPEKQITEKGVIGKVYDDTAIIVDKTGVPVLPIHLNGLLKTRFSQSKSRFNISKNSQISIHIHPHQTLQFSANSKKRYPIASSQVYDLLCEAQYLSQNIEQDLLTAILQKARLMPNKFTIAEDIQRQPITYKNLTIRCLILAKLLERKTNEHRIGLMLPNSVAATLSLLALMAINRIPVMLNFVMGAEGMIDSCHTGSTKTVVTAHHFIQKAELTNEIEKMKSAGIQFIYLDDFVSEVKIHHKLIALMKSRKPLKAITKLRKDSQFDSPTADTTAIIIFTSGSEATPKGVALSHKNILSNFHQTICRIDFHEKDTLFSSLPLFHSFGLVVGTFLPLLQGVKVFFYPSPLHFKIIPDLVYQTRSTVFFATNVFYKNYDKHADLYDFSNLRYAIAGAEKLQETTVETWAKKYGVRILQGYGITECSPVVSLNNSIYHKVGSVGRFIVGITYELHPVEGIAKGGELYLHGNNVMQGYYLYDNPSKLIPPKDGLHHSGDVVEIDEEGYITIIDRCKRFAKIAGEMISLTKIECLLLEFNSTPQYLVVAIESKKKGEEVVVLSTQEISLKEFAQFLKQQSISLFHCPDKLISIEKIPVTGTGKANHIKAKEIVQQKVTA